MWNQCTISPDKKGHSDWIKSRVWRTTGIWRVGSITSYEFHCSQKRNTLGYIGNNSFLNRVAKEAAGRKRLVLFRSSLGWQRWWRWDWAVNNHTCTRDDLTRIYRSGYYGKGTFFIQTSGADVVCNLKTSASCKTEVKERNKNI